MTPTIVSTDEQIAEAVAAWLDARGSVPEREWPAGIVVRFRYPDGTGGSVAWEPERQHTECDTERSVGPWFAYNLRNASHAAGLYFTPEIFRDSAGPIIPVLRRECHSALGRAA